MAYQSQFDQQGMSQAALDAWQRFEQATGRGWGINSAYRDPNKNAAVGGASKSQHMNGNAFDIDVSGLSEAERVELIRTARAAGFGGVGVYNNALHFDVAGERNWGPDFKSGSTPEWALPALQGGHAHGDGHDHGAQATGNAQIGADTMDALGLPRNAPQRPAQTPYDAMQGYGDRVAIDGTQGAFQPLTEFDAFEQRRNALAQIQPPQYQNALNVADFLRPVQANALSRGMINNG